MSLTLAVVFAAAPGAVYAATVGFLMTWRDREDPGD